MQFPASSPLLAAMDFSDITGGTTNFLVEDHVPEGAYRGVNEGFNDETGTWIVNGESLRICGAEIVYDTYLARTQAILTREVYEANRIKGIVRTLERDFIKGSSSNPRQWLGLQARIGDAGTQVLDNSTDVGGGPCSLNMLDEVISLVEDPTHIIMPKPLRLKLTQATRNNEITNVLVTTPENIGRQLFSYGGIPIIELDEDAAGNKILPFTEANPGGGTPASSSIYVVSFGPTGVQGIQNGGMEVFDLGQMQDKPAFKTRISWFSSFGIGRRRAVARLRGITNAPFVA